MINKTPILLSILATVVLCFTLCSCGDSRETVQPGSPQWNALHADGATPADIQSGKKVTITVPPEMIAKPGQNGGNPAPAGVTIQPEGKK